MDSKDALLWGLSIAFIIQNIAGLPALVSLVLSGVAIFFSVKYGNTGNKPRTRNKD